MAKRKVASTSKASNLQASKAARSKKDERNQAKRGKPKPNTKAKLSDQRKLQFSPDLSSILRNSESQEDDEQNDLYDNPLHSTAVFSGDLEENDENDKGDEYLAPSYGREKPIRQPGEKVRTKKGLGLLARISEGAGGTEREMDTEDNSEESNESSLETAKKSELERKTVKNASSSRARKASKLSKNVPARKSAGKITSDGNPGVQQRAVSAGARKRSLGNTRASISTHKKRRKQQEGSSSDSRRDSPLTEPCMEISPRNKDETSGKKKKKTLARTSSESDASPVPSTSRPATPEDGPLTMKIWCPEGIKRSSKDVTELDVVLNDFEQIVQEYQKSVKSVICQKVVNKFFMNFKEQVIETLNQVQDVKNMERRNAKVTATFNKTRKHFLVAQKELNEQEVELKRLQKEHSELSQKKADLQSVKQFLSGFKQMHTQYIEHRNQNPSEEETYDISSFPALLLEARGILGAEKQLHIINTKLEQSLAKK